MRKMIIMLILPLTISNSFAQWSTFVGGSLNMTMDNTKGYHSRLRIAQNADTALSITPSIGGGGEVGCSYLLKRHHFFSFQIKYSYQKYNTSTISGPYKIPYSSKFEYHTNNFFDSYISIQIPLIYGYSILNKANFFFFTPYVGWVNQFNFLKGAI